MKGVKPEVKVSKCRYSKIYVLVWKVSSWVNQKLETRWELKPSKARIWLAKNETFHTQAWIFENLHWLIFTSGYKKALLKLVNGLWITSSAISPRGEMQPMQIFKKSSLGGMI